MSEQRPLSFCHPGVRPNRIPALASLAGKCAWLAVTLTTTVGRLAKYFGHPVDVTGAVNGWPESRVVGLTGARSQVTLEDPVYRTDRRSS